MVNIQTIAPEFGNRVNHLAIPYEKGDIFQITENTLCYVRFGERSVPMVKYEYNGFLHSIGLIPIARYATGELKRILEEEGTFADFLSSILGKDIIIEDIKRLDDGRCYPISRFTDEWD